MKDYSLHSNYRTFLLLSGVIVLATTTGCSERLMRENVFVNTETGLGIFVAQNPRTQVHEAKIGFFRHELFFVPTSKTIMYEIKDGKRVEKAVVANDPSKTPNVLALIAIGVIKSDGIAKFAVRQRLAVGKFTVEAHAATVLMAGDSIDAAVLAASQELASKQINLATNPTPVLTTARVDYATQIIKPFKNDVQLSDGTKTKDPEVFADDLANKLIEGETADGIIFHGPPEAATKIVDELKKIPL